MSRSRSDSATTGLGNSGYQSAGARLDVRTSDFPALSVMSSYRSSAWAAVSSRIAKSSIYLAVEQIFAMFSQVATLMAASAAWSGDADAVLLEETAEPEK